MSKNNAVTAVLVTSGNQVPLVAGNTIDALAPGQIGVFDAQTGLSVNSGSNVAKEIFIAVGLDRDGDTVLDDIVQSAGQVIQTKNVKAYNFREHTAAQPMKGIVGGYSGECETDYAIKVEFRNQQIYRTQGNVQFTKTYAFRTDCCDDCVSCPSGDANEVTLKLVAAVNADEAGLLIAQAVARDTITIKDHGTSANYTAGDPISDADIAIIMAFNALQTDDTLKVYTDVELTSVALAINSYCSVNLKYFNPRGTLLVVSLVDGFNCSGSFTETQSLAYEEGNGYDIAQKEYHAAGNQQNKPYVVSDSTGVPISFDVFADKAEKYDQFTIEYDQESSAGWLEYQNNLRTIIAIPNQDKLNTSAELDLILAKQFSYNGFGVISDAISDANISDSAVSSTSDVDDIESDGIA